MKEGDFVEISYVARVKDGEVFDTTYEDVAKKEGIYKENAKYGPIPIIIGAGHVIKGLEKALLSMQVGEEKVVEIKPEDAFGKRNPKLVKVFSIKAFKDVPKIGQVVNFNGVVGIVKSVSGGRVLVDFNYPLAGKILEYKVKIERKIVEKKDKIDALLRLHLPVKAKFTLDNSVVKIYLPDEAKKIATIFVIQEKIAKDMLKYVEDIKEIQFIYTYNKDERVKKEKENKG